MQDPRVGSLPYVQIFDYFPSVSDKEKKKVFLLCHQIVHPAPEGPFRKAPWHGNIHVLKF
jgi:hypothetical protein